MTHWQARATLENGAVVLFGLKADSGEEALALARERLADAGQPVTELVAGLLAAAAAR